MNLNRIILVGNLTRDPEMKSTQSGQNLCTFGLATNRIWTDPDTKEKQKNTEFHNIVLWGRLAEISSQYLQKGSLVLVEGRIQTRSWEDNSGNKRYRTEVVGQNIQFGPKSSQQNSPQLNQNQPKQEKEEDIPVIEERAEIPSKDKKKDKEENKGQDEEINVEDIPF